MIRTWLSDPVFWNFLQKKPKTWLIIILLSTYATTNLLSFLMKDTYKKHWYLTHLVQMGHRGRRVGRSCELGQSGERKIYQSPDVCPSWHFLGNIFQFIESLWTLSYQNYLCWRREGLTIGSSSDYWKQVISFFSEWWYPW